VTYPVLYSFRRCPYAMRARLALLSSGVVCELREIVLRNKPAEMLAISPKGTVPVLQLPDGQVLEQSLDIMLWALSRNDPGRWLAADPAWHAQQLAWIARCDGEFKTHLDRYKYPNRYDLPDGLASRAQGSAFLAALNTALEDSVTLAGTRWGLADAAIAPFVRQWAHTDTVWFAGQPWPDLQRWLQGFENSPAFECAMAKFAPWQAGSTATLWPSTAKAS
jgi:glutathione S-transferase